jgi:predicted glycosyltransferase
MPPLFSFFEKTVFALQHRLIRNFNEIWIPDSTNAIMNLSADLSHKYQRHTNTKYIGILSQFKKEIEKNLQHEYVIAVILSGPEPHRTLFEKEIIELIITLQLKSVIVGGTFSPNTKVKNNLISYIPFANTNELQKIYSQSTYIICRSGYTSLMDLIILRKPALLIPTPSQTEQEYLSKYVSERNWFKMIKQQDIKHITIQSLQQLEKMTLPYISTFNQKDFVF